MELQTVEAPLLSGVKSQLICNDMLPQHLYCDFQCIEKMITWVSRERQRGLITLEVQGCSAPLKQSKTLVITMKSALYKNIRFFSSFLA